jgi:type II secretory pathway pseudopilin PulG
MKQPSRDIKSLCCKSDGFSLVEVTIAVGIAGFCLVAMLGLLPSGMKCVKTSVEQTQATSLLGSIVTDLRSCAQGSITSPILGISLPMDTDSGSSDKTVSSGVPDTYGGNSPKIVANRFYLNELGNRVGSNDLGARYGVDVALSNTAFNTTGRIQIWWPAQAAPVNAQGMVETVTAVSR